MLFSVYKCKIMHFGHDNAQANYYIEGTLLPTCTVEHDLGVLIHNMMIIHACISKNKAVSIRLSKP